MGLSGRKVKQRIGKDPRNLSWADGQYPPLSVSLARLSSAKFHSSSRFLHEQMPIASDRPTLQNSVGMHPRVSVHPERDV
jgi:hypothetical protein